jgi:hypothetical protein
MAPTQVPSGTVAEVLAWVGSDTTRAAAALKAELAGKHRSSLVAQLEQLVTHSERSPHQRRIELGRGLLDDAEQLRAQLFAPCVERRAIPVSDGPAIGGHVEIVDVERDRPTFADQKVIAQTIALVLDTSAELLAEEATAGGGVLHDLGAERAARRRSATSSAATSAG